MWQLPNIAANLFMYTIRLNQGVTVMGLETGLLNNIN